MFRPWVHPAGFVLVQTNTQTDRQTDTLIAILGARQSTGRSMGIALTAVEFIGAVATIIPPVAGVCSSNVDVRVGALELVGRTAC